MLLLMFSYWSASGQCDSPTTVSDGSFESIQSPCTPGQNQYTEAFNEGCMGDWFAGKGTPTLVKSGFVTDNSGVINTPTGGGSYYAELFSNTTSQTPSQCKHEALVLDLTLDPGCSYDITLWSRVYDDPMITNESSDLTVYFTSGLTNAVGAIGPENCLAAPMDAETQTVNSFTWAQYSFNIPAETGDDQLVIFATSKNSTSFRTLIDLVTIEVCESGLNPGLSQSPDAQGTYDALLSAAPYLSDEVLLDLLASGLAAWKKETVLLESAPLSATVMAAAESAVDAAVYQTLEDIRLAEGVSHVELLLADKSRLETQKAQLLYTLYQGYLQEGEWGAAEDMLLADASFAAMRLLAGMKMRAGAFDEAIAHVSNFPTASEAEEAISQMLMIEAAYRQNPGSYTLPEEDEAYLQALSQDTLSSTYSLSRALLTQITGEPFAPVVAPYESAEGLQQAAQGLRQAPAAKQGRADLTVLPNPAQGQALVLLPGAAGNGWEIQLFNASGIRVRNLSVSGTQAQVNLQGLPSGFYILEAQPAGGQQRYRRTLIVR